jgi:predicted nuclease of predicted toxin-antitoxin system
LLADENFNGDILRGLRRRVPGIDAPRIQHVGMRGADDEAVLEWAAVEGRLVLTHDVSTLIDFAWKRVAAGLHHSGVSAVSQQAPVGAIVADLVLLAECSVNEEWADRILFVPF